jgi:hypothetical protein
MKKLLFTSVIALFMGIASTFAQSSPIFTGKVLFDKFAANSEVIMDIPGFTYKYSGDWLRFMKLENDNVISFSRGRVTHHYDIRKIVLLEEEGNYVKVFLR